MLDNLSDSFLIPSRWKLGLPHFFPFRRQPAVNGKKTLLLSTPTVKSILTSEDPAPREAINRLLYTESSFILPVSLLHSGGYARPVFFSLTVRNDKELPGLDRAKRYESASVGRRRITLGASS